MRKTFLIFFFLNLLICEVKSQTSTFSSAKPDNSTGLKEKPNMVIILADDLSYYDISAYGAKNIVTPNIDNLAKEGIKFNNAYNSATMCTPTRHSLLTGQFPIKHGGYANHSKVNKGVKSMPHYLNSLGYRVGLTGKWHIGPNESFPFERIPGFEPKSTARDVSYHLEGVKKFITEEEPFCMVVASVNPHGPWTAGDPSEFNPKDLKLPPHFVDTDVTRKAYSQYLAEVRLLDNEVGDIVSLLKKHNKYENTLLLFLSEQGSKFSGNKWTVWNSGVKAGMMAVWKNQISVGIESDAIIQYEDILPTFIELAGGDEITALDGKSFKEVILEEKDTHRKYAYGVHNNIPEGPAYPIRSITDGKYKLIHNLTPDAVYVEKHIEKADWFLTWKDKATEDIQSASLLHRFKKRPEYEFYNIQEDPFELQNLANLPIYKNEMMEMNKELKKWMAEQGDEGVLMDVPRKKK